MGSKLDFALRPETYQLYRQRLQELTGVLSSIAETDILYHVGVGLSVDPIRNIDERMQAEPFIKAAAVVNGKLSSPESYAIFERAFIQALAETIFGNHEKALRWLTKPKQAFDGQTPVQMLEQESGAAHVTTMLIRIAEGYFA